MITSLHWRAPPERISSSPATHISPNSSKLGHRWSLHEVFCSDLLPEASPCLIRTTAFEIRSQSIAGCVGSDWFSLSYGRNLYFWRGAGSNCWPYAARPSFGRIPKASGRKVTFDCRTPRSCLTVECSLERANCRWPQSALAQFAFLDHGEEHRQQDQHRDRRGDHATDDRHRDWFHHIISDTAF